MQGSKLESEIDQGRSLKACAVRRLVLALIAYGAILFVPGSLRFWQGGLFLGLMAGFWIFFFISFLKHDPKLLERRLQGKETEPRQKLFQKLFGLIGAAAFILTGLDFRFGWSRTWVRPVPLARIIMAQLVVVLGYWLVYWVMKTNTFASSTIRVETEQTVIERGPYAMVRHPMYTGMALTVLAAPLALGSFVAWPVFALLVPVLVYRLIHEEKTLVCDLPGYADYCERTRFRLVPWIW
jgi:protein-S-isoprenylcysteine O-methyltransferase Ste14